MDGQDEKWQKRKLPPLYLKMALLCNNQHFVEQYIVVFICLVVGVGVTPTLFE